MARDLDFETTPLAEEFDVGDDSDLPGFDQPITGDDIDAILNSSRATESAKREQLLRIRDDLAVRQRMDEADEYGELVRQINDAIAALKAPADGLGTPGAYGFDPADRALQPDEILERAEEENEDDRRA
jgi:hypothetical protein